MIPFLALNINITSGFLPNELPFFTVPFFWIVGTWMNHNIYFFSCPFFGHEFGSLLGYPLSSHGTRFFCSSSHKILRWGLGDCVSYKRCLFTLEVNAWKWALGRFLQSKNCMNSQQKPNTHKLRTFLLRKISILAIMPTLIIMNRDWSQEKTSRMPNAFWWYGFSNES